MKFRPLHDRVVIKRIEAEEKTSGGIIIPDTAKEKPQEGEVIAVGPGGRDENGKLIPIDVKVGDGVLFGKWSGTEVKLDGVEYIIMKESDLMGGADGSWRCKKGRLILPERLALVLNPLDWVRRNSRAAAQRSNAIKASGVRHGCQGSEILGRCP